MKIAISVTAPRPGARFDPRFGRAAAFILVETDTGERQIVGNPAAQLDSGAGIRAAEFLTGYDVDAVISGAFGPKARTVLHTSGVRLYQATSGTVDKLIAQALTNELNTVENAE